VVAAAAAAIRAEGRGDATIAPIRVPPVAPIYNVIRTLPAGTVIAEFPFGDPRSEIVYTFFAGFHRKPIVNGYSGYFPQNYVRLVARLAPLPSDPDAWPALLGSGATHAVVHEAAINGAAI